MSAAPKQCEVVIVGAGHAGCEAALAAHRLGASVVMVTLRMEGIAQMSCNPAIGGVGKGHLVREIDALGGAMAEVADETGIQFRSLNKSRGAAVRATRVQSDAQAYRETMQARLSTALGLVILEGEVVEVTTQNGRVSGVVLASGQQIAASAVVVTTGTFLRGVCHTGKSQRPGGRAGDLSAGHLTQALMTLGLRFARFKTGTTPRLHSDSIDWSILTPQPGDDPRPHFSFEPVAPRLGQIDCHLTYTTPSTHAVIRGRLEESPLYTGAISGLGPRYCPSLEDKVVRFAERDRHQIFLEPEGHLTKRVYPNGLSTSLPEDAQLAFLRTIPGLENVSVMTYGYAVEYDYAPPEQLTRGLMVKHIPGLFLAGQINGSSGYEEAAAQGLMGGLNAVRFVAKKEPAILGRDEAYIGVLIDDLVTHGVDEPYRIFTSRAEQRLTLRESNAEERLYERANQWGLISSARYGRAKSRHRARLSVSESLTQPLGAKQASILGLDHALYAGRPRIEVLQRPEKTLRDVLGTETEGLLEKGIARICEEEAKYAGYIVRESRAIAKLVSMERIALSPEAQYMGQSGLSGELQEKLAKVRPTTLGQASRVRGMTPAALALLRMQAHKWAKGSPVSRETIADEKEAVKPRLRPTPDMFHGKRGEVGARK